MLLQNQKVVKKHLKLLRKIKVMSIYKYWKHGSSVKALVKEYGLRKTFSSFRNNLNKKIVRIKHNRIQLLSNNNKWVYER
jgi:hypothetical protein